MKSPRWFPDGGFFQNATVGWKNRPKSKLHLDGCSLLDEFRDLIEVHVAVYMKPVNTCHTTRLSKIV
jgi:hypothetical protein